MSCNSQVDLEKLKINEHISPVIEKINHVNNDVPWGYNLIGYASTDIEQFRYGDISFTKHNNLNLYEADYDYIALLVDDYNSNNLTGIFFNLVNEEVAIKLFDFIKNKYGDPEHRRREGMEDNDTEDAFVWENSMTDEMILFEKDKNSNDRNGNPISTTKCYILKKGLQMPFRGIKEEDMPRLKEMIKANPKTMDILWNFKYIYSQVIEKN